VASPLHSARNSGDIAALMEDAWKLPHGPGRLPAATLPLRR